MRDEDAKRPNSAQADSAASTGNGADDAPEGAGTRTAPDAAQEVAVLKAELTELKDRWMRERADLENFKRRAVKEKSDALRFGSEALLKDLIPIIDNLHRALAHARTSNEVDPIVTGVEMVLRGFDEVLGRHGVKVVEARGVPFDPSRHEAISHIESEGPANTVIDEHQRGYVLHDRLLRPALVTVGKGRRPDVAKPSDDD
jgi:molecular chaperone GrpE